MRDYYLFLKNSVYTNYFDMSKYFIEYNNYIVKTKNTLDRKLYNKVDDILKNNNYLLDIDKLFDELKPLNLSYNKINEIENITKDITIRKINIEIKKIIGIYKEFKKIDNAIYLMKEKKDYSLNKYYGINETTKDYILYYIYSKITSYNSRIMLKSYNIILQLYDKTVESVRENNIKYMGDSNTLAYNLFFTLRFKDYDKLYTLRKEESDLRDYQLFNISSKETKNFYRKLLTNKINSSSYLKHHKIEDLYKGASTKLYISNTNYKFKTLIIFNNIKTYETIDKIINDYKDYDRKFLFYIKTDKIKESYYINMASDTKGFIESYDKNILYKENVKYIIVLNNDKFNINSIYKLINILEHPNNHPYKDKNKYSGIIELKFKYNKVYSYIYNFVFADKNFKDIDHTKLPYKTYKLKDNLFETKESFNSIVLSGNKFNMIYYNGLYLYSNNKLMVSNYKLIFNIDNEYIDSSRFLTYIDSNIIYMNYKNINIRISVINGNLVTEVSGTKTFYIYFDTDYDKVNFENNKINFSFNNTNYYIYGEKIEKLYNNKYNVYDKDKFDIIDDNYSDIEKCICCKVKTNNKAFLILSCKQNEMVKENDFINISSSSIYSNNDYNKLIYLTFNPVYDNYKSSLILYNTLNPNQLNKYGLSIDDKYLIIENFKNNILKDVFNFYKYLKERNINIKLVFIYEKEKDKNNIDKFMYLYLKDKETDLIKLIDKNSINNKELTLIYLGSIYNIKDTISEFISHLKNENNNISHIKSFKIDEKLELSNKLGGFKDKELVIKNYDRVLPINKLISNNMISYTSPLYSYTTYKGMYITNKSNLYKDSSESIVISGKSLVYDSFTVKDGITKRHFKRENTEVYVTETLSIIDDVKMFKVEIKSSGNNTVSIGLHLDVNNLYDRYHYSEFNKEDNLVKIKNSNNLFLTCTKNIISYENDTALTNVRLKDNEFKTVTFTLGVAENEKDIWFLKEKYGNETTIDTSIKILENNLKNTYHRLNIYTNSNKLNLIFNKILPYNIYINDISDYELSLVCNIFKDCALNRIKEYKLSLEYINLIYKYIYYFEDFTLINNDIYKKLEKILLSETNYNFIYEESINSFIGLTKMLYKRKSTKRYEDLRNNVKKDKTYIYKLINSKDETFLRLFKKDIIMSYKGDNYVINNSPIYYYATLKYLGIVISNDKLMIENPLLKRKYSFNYKYNNSNYFVTVKFGKKKSITLDGNEIKTKYIKLKNDLKKHEAVIEIVKED